MSLVKEALTSDQGRLKKDNEMQVEKLSKDIEVLSQQLSQSNNDYEVTKNQMQQQHEGELNRINEVTNSSNS